MHLSTQIAQHFRQFYFGGNWTSVHLKAQVENLDWQIASQHYQNLNSIAELVYHIQYYVAAVTQVLKGGPLDAHDKYSFDLPEIRSQMEWEAFLEKVWQEGEAFAKLIEALPESSLAEAMADPKYGSYLRNLWGIIEHGHYHLGQVALIKKLLRLSVDSAGDV